MSNKELALALLALVAVLMATVFVFMVADQGTTRIDCIKAGGAWVDSPRPTCYIPDSIVVKSEILSDD